tara:strand:+ start:71 stop:265 length:195 start_codon:yes stop_codon:yes gene_type:complete
MIVEKVSYQIDWVDFKRGTSFFIPCLDTTKTKKEIGAVMKRFKFKVLQKVVIQEGIKGVRVWRV